MWYVMDCCRTEDGFRLLQGEDQVEDEKRNCWTSIVLFSGTLEECVTFLHVETCGRSRCLDERD